MSASTLIRDSVDTLKETAREAYDTLKTAAHDRVLDPLSEAGKSAASAVRHKAEDAMDCTRRNAARAEEWVKDNPFSAAGMAFGAGLAIGVYLLTRRR